MQIRVKHKKTRGVEYKYWIVDFRYETEEIKNNLIKSGLISKSLTKNYLQKNYTKKQVIDHVNDLIEEAAQKVKFAKNNPKKVTYTIDDLFAPGKLLKDPTSNQNKKMLSDYETNNDQTVKPGFYIKERFQNYLVYNKPAIRTIERDLCALKILHKICGDMKYEDFDANEFQRDLYKYVMENGFDWGDPQINKIKKYTTFNKYLMVIQAAFKDILNYENDLPTLYQTPYKFAHLKKVDEPSGKDKLRNQKANRIDDKNINKVYTRMLENYKNGNTKARGSQVAEYMTNKLDLHWRLLIETALRKSEAIALKWSDLTLKELNGQKIGLLHIERQWNNSAEDFTALKNKKERTVGVSYEFYLELMELKKSQPKCEQTNGLMFPNTNGDVDKRDTLYKSLYNANKSLFGSLDEGGKNWVRPHDLRHYHTTNKLKNGANLQLVSKTLGHSDQKITASIYVQDYDINIEEQLAYNQI